MTMEGPRPLKEQEDQDREAGGVEITVDQEEAALALARKEQKKNPRAYREEQGPPVKKLRTAATYSSSALHPTLGEETPQPKKTSPPTNSRGGGAGGPRVTKKAAQEAEGAGGQGTHPLTRSTRSIRSSQWYVPFFYRGVGGPQTPTSSVTQSSLEMFGFVTTRNSHQEEVEDEEVIEVIDEQEKKEEKRRRRIDTPGRRGGGRGESRGSSSPTRG